MSTLPDITTSNVGYIAYWNAINQGGVGSITASDVLSDSNIESYTLYDNGFTASYSSPLNGNRDMTLRVKQDGWFVVYIDRTNNFAQSVSTYPHGYWDIIYNWGDNTSSTDSFPVNTLERVINSAQGQLSNSGSITYNSSDVGLYNYEYSSASTSTMFSSNTSGNETSGLIYTSGTNVLFASSQGHSYESSISFEGTTITTNSGNSKGTLNLLSNGLIPNSQTEYNMGISGSNRTTGSVLTIWS